MKKKIIGIIVLIAAVLSTSACAESQSRSQTSLERILSMTPASFGSFPLEFSHYARALELQGYDTERDRGYDDVKEFYLEWLELGKDPFARLAYPPGLNKSSGGEAIGLSGVPLFAFDLGIWFFTGFGRGSYEKPTFFNIEGRYFPEQIVSAMETLEYKKVNFRDFFYYGLHPNNAPVLDYPLRTHTLNRVAVIDDWFVAAAATQQMEDLINVRDGHVESLLQSKAHLTLAQAVNGDLLSGTYRDLSAIKNPGSPVNFSAMITDKLQPYMDGPNEWQSLTPFVLSLSGYRVRDGIDEIVIALYYDDPIAAQEDQVQLEHRWNTFEWDFATNSDPMPLVNGCSPFSTETLIGEDYSVLVANCPLVRGLVEDQLIDNPYMWQAVPHFVLSLNIE